MPKSIKPESNLTKFIIFSVIGIFSVVFIFSLSFLIESKTVKQKESKIIAGNFNPDKLKPESEWKEILTPEQFHILREKGTDIPFTKDLTDNKQKGVFVSVGCEEPVFSSSDKFDSKTGWPSFTKPISEDVLVLQEDYSLGYKRVEVLDKCGGHLGHVFEDGPEPTGLRYCINATALRFIPEN